ncbi:MAG: HU family DNA-binding protein [Mycoplasma sp.]
MKTNKPMTKNEILRKVIEISQVNSVELTIKQAAVILESYEKVLLTEWISKKEFKFFTIGKFKIKQKKEREGINPLTKETVLYPAKVVPVFKFNKSTKDLIEANVAKE